MFYIIINRSCRTVIKNYIKFNIRRKNISNKKLNKVNNSLNKIFKNNIKKTNLYNKESL